MKNTVLSIFSIAIFVGGFFFLYFSGPVKQEIPVANPLRQSYGEVSQKNQQINLKQSLESKTDNQSAVTVTVTPTDTLFQSKEWRFNVILSTHSVELDQDMAKISVLVDDNGKEYRPLRWEGAEAGGHHREGVLVFNQITQTPESVELKISGISDVVRNFSWQLR